MVAPQFLNIGTDEATPLQSIVPTGDSLSDNVVIQTLTPYGYTASAYMWIDYAGDDGDQAAWVDPDTYEIVEGVSFEPGQGLWVQGSESSQALQTAGKVGLADVAITLREGATGTGNPFPTSVALQDILPSGDDLSDNVVIQTLTPYGYTASAYMWIDYAGDDGDQAAWVDPDTYEIVEGVSFAPGQGLWVQGSSASQSITFPAPEL